MIKPSNNPKANPKGQVCTTSARFTILTPRVIRLEWTSKPNQFIDNASMIFVNRFTNFADCHSFQTVATKEQITIQTEQFKLSQTISNAKFSKENLQIKWEINNFFGSWYPGLENKGNLLGTINCLDRCNGNIQTSEQKSEEIKLESGLLSREGWTLIDDSKTALFDWDQDWPWVIPRQDAEHSKDLYLFIQGSDQKQCLADFTLLAGKIPIPPKFAFGYWYSRQWDYTDLEIIEIVEECKENKIPLDVVVIDMDWHISSPASFYDEKGKKMLDQLGQNKGWTGFTWNKKMFVDPIKFLNWKGKEKIKLCLNLHPASGIHKHEEVFEKFAKEMGEDQTKIDQIKFDIVDKKWATNYFKIVLHPLEDTGVDFWWLDWQQWSSTSIPNLNPTFYLNYVHFSDMEKREKARSIVFHRQGGLGNHRYPIGFSGDTIITWKSLAFQPFFTATASNVCFGYWSHDIGGHWLGNNKEIGLPNELMVRWIQFGVFSPILRTHSTKKSGPIELMERKIWMYPYPFYRIMKDYIKLRYALFPQIQTGAFFAYQTGISLIRPMYYEFPLDELSYKFTNTQYYFGNDLILAPICKPMGINLQGYENYYADQEIWIPPGSWVEMQSGKMFNGSQIIKRSQTLKEMPIFVKDFSIIPMQPEMQSIGEIPIDPLILNVFCLGECGECKTSVQMDEGNNNNQLKGEQTITEIIAKKTKNVLNVTILPVLGKFRGNIEEREYEIKVPFSFPPDQVFLNGKETYNIKQWGFDFLSIIKTERFNVQEKVEIKIVFPNEDITILSDFRRKFKRMIEVQRLLKEFCLQNTNELVIEDIIDISQAGNRINNEPTPGKIKSEIEKFVNGINWLSPKLVKIVEANPTFLSVLQLFLTITRE